MRCHALLLGALETKVRRAIISSVATRETEFSPAVEDYAKAIYALQERRRAGRDHRARAAAGRHAGLGVGHGRKLDELGLVTHERYRGVRLTETGTRLALEMIRHHRLLELYLAESLGVPWDRVHQEAEVLEHVLSEELEALIAAKLGNPTHDPHGDPIPSADLVIAEEPTECLSTLEPGADGDGRAHLATPSRRCCATSPSARSSPATRLRRWSTSSRSAARCSSSFGVTRHALGGQLAASMRVRA